MATHKRTIATCKQVLSLLKQAHLLLKKEVLANPNSEYQTRLQVAAQSISKAVTHTTIVRSQALKK